MHAHQKISEPELMQEVFGADAESPWLADARERLGSFVAAHPEPCRIACVSSGGTTVPLERNTVRFIDNFSTGNRGAAMAEALLDAGYAVVFLHREHSAFPFARKLLPPAVPADAWLRAPAAAAAERERAASRFAACEPRLLSLPFTSVTEYLRLLREASKAVGACGARGMLCLAAAVSDFYVPPAELPEHKIQSGGGDGLTLQLRPVPKVLGAIKRGGGEAAWAPRAFAVSFKLETNPAILLAKAAGAISKYGVDLVVANLLQTYKREVVLVSAAAGESAAAAPVVGDESEEVRVEGVATAPISLDGAADGAELDELLVKELVARHAAVIG